MAVTVERAHELTAEFCREYPVAGELHYHIQNTTEDLYGKQASQRIPATVTGGFVPADSVLRPGRCDIAVANVADVRELRATLRHEVLGHFGLLTLRAEEKRAVLEAIVAARDEPSLADHWADADTYYPGATPLQKAEEIYAIECEAIEPQQSIDRTLGERALREACIERSRPMQREDLQAITSMVADGLRDRTRSQQIFPKNPADQFRVASINEVKSMATGQVSSAAGVGSEPEAAKTIQGEGVRLASLGDGTSTGEVDRQTGEVVIRRDGQAIVRFENEDAIDEFADRQKLSDDDREVLRGLGLNAEVERRRILSEIAATLAQAAEERAREAGVLAASEPAVAVSAPTPAPAVQDQAQALSESAVASPSSWSKDEAAEMARRDAMEYAASESQASEPEVRERMLRIASESPAYRAALEEKVPLLYERLNLHEQRAVEAAKGTFIDPGQDERKQGTEQVVAAADEASAVEKRRREEAIQAALAATNSVDVQRKGGELDRDEFIIPRRITLAYTEHEGKFFAKDSNRMMFHDQGEKLATSTTDKTAIADMVAYAKAKQWESLKLTGSQEFRREAWLQAESQGIKTQGYTPKAVDLVALKTLTQERSTNVIAPVVEERAKSRPAAPVQEVAAAPAPRHDLNKDQAGAAAAVSQGRTSNITELQKNPAFEKYSVEDLSKIAFYRALLIEREKGAPPNLREEALANFDTAMSDPQKVKELPEQEVKIVEREKVKERSQQRDTAEQSL